ncbi:MAG TPA: MFS transporter, partial [Micromonosporaceae bacterium]
AALRVVLAAIALVGFGVGSVIVAVAGYAEAAGSTAWAGWLLAAQAAGALMGGLAYTRVHVSDERRWLPWLTAALAAGYSILLLTPAPPAMIALMAISGLALPPLLTATFITVDTVAPAGTAAEAFAWVATSFTIGSAAGSALDGALVDSTGSLLAGFALPPAAIALAALVFAAARGVRQTDGPTGP